MPEGKDNLHGLALIIITEMEGMLLGRQGCTVYVMLTVNFKIT